MIPINILNSNLIIENKVLISLLGIDSSVSLCFFPVFSEDKNYFM